MKRTVSVALLVAALAACLVIPLAATAGTGIHASLDSEQIVNQSGGDPDGSATITLKVNRVKQRICYSVRFQKIADVTGAFLHKGGPGQIARPIVTFFEAKAATSPRSGCVHNVRKRIVKRLKRKPTAHYVDITSAKHPNGAVRGQLSR